MSIERHVVPGLFPPPDYAHVAVAAGRLVLTAGGVPLDPDGTLVGPGDYVEQTRRVIANLLAALEAGGAGADGPGKAEIAVAEIARSRVFCDDWEQASHGGELAAAVSAGAVARGDVTMLGDVLAGGDDGRRSDDEITLFDSTGLAIQDLAIALAALERLDELDVPRFEP